MLLASLQNVKKKAKKDHIETVEVNDEPLKSEIITPQGDVDESVKEHLEQPFHKHGADNCTQASQDGRLTLYLFYCATLKLFVFL